MSTATLTSLAMLKVNVDQGRDYLDYLRPFILQVLCDHKPNPVIDAAVRDCIRAEFGLEIPERAVQMVLKRLARQRLLTREQGVFRIKGNLPNPGIGPEKADAERHIRAVVNGLIDFSKNTARPIGSENEAVDAICGFLSEFNIPCLRAFLRGTTIPALDGHDDAVIVLVSQYVLTLQQTDPDRFNSFLVVVTGHMLANALLCPDLQQAPKSYKGVTFYFDTPLLVRRLGLEGSEKEEALETLVTLLRNLGATVATFSHSRDELERVVSGAASFVESFDGGGEIVMTARHNGTSKSDLLVIAGQIGERLSSAGIDVIQTPHYAYDFQIDEKAFENVLKDEVWYHNPRAKEDDINSVRSIYVLRSGYSPTSLERSKAVLVTSNSGFAQAAFAYGKDHEESREVSSVITDFSLANIAWLKSPLGAPTLPMTEVIAFSYAALQPRKELLDKYLGEIDKLVSQDKISEQDHQLLRSSNLAQQELMNLTLGDEAALTEQTVTQTLSRVTSEIKKEEIEKLTAEQAAHRQTQQALALEKSRRNDAQQRVFWRCSRRAKQYSWIIAAVIGLALVGGIAVGLGVTSTNRLLGWILTGLFVTATCAGVINLLVGISVRQIRESMERGILTWMIRREVAITGLDITEPK